MLSVRLSRNGSVNHPNKASNIAEGIWNPEFKKAIKPV